MVLGRDMYLESRESPTTIWRLDPIVAAALGSGIMGQLTSQLQNPIPEGYVSFETGVFVSAGSSHEETAKTSLGEGTHSSMGGENSAFFLSTWIEPSVSQSSSVLAPTGGVPSPGQTFFGESDNSSSPPDSNSLTWGNDQFMAGLEPLLNTNSLFAAPFDSAGVPGGGGMGGEDSLSPLGPSWQWDRQRK